MPDDALEGFKISSGKLRAPEVGEGITSAFLKNVVAGVEQANAEVHSPRQLAQGAETNQYSASSGAVSTAFSNWAASTLFQPGQIVTVDTWHAMLVHLSSSPRTSEATIYDDLFYWGVLSAATVEVEVVTVPIATDPDRRALTCERQNDVTGTPDQFSVYGFDALETFLDLQVVTHAGSGEVHEIIPNYVVGSPLMITWRPHANGVNWVDLNVSPRFWAEP